MNLQLSEYQKVCAMNVIAKMQELAVSNNLKLSEINQTNVMQILQQVTMLELNITSVPRECYIIIRSFKTGDGWTKGFEFGIEGDGNDKLLRRYGVDIEKVYPFWLVREGDEFTYPAFKGIEIEPPTWVPKGYVNKVIRVVYPIKNIDGSIQYNISEREEVRINLAAHIKNNVKMNKEITANKKAEIDKLLATLSMDEMFNNNELLNIMSPAWRDSHSREAMIVRKLRNNCIKKIPKDFANAFTAATYEKTFDDYEQYQDTRINKEEALEAEVAENIGTETLTISANEETGEIIETEVIQHVEPVATRRPF